ncbi:MAG: translation elongation factor Ts [Candidatus Berkelbacteria bacterium]|nr:translation elongation factor Ts [Candidatus Berkelbacteria bacterium]
MEKIKVLREKTGAGVMDVKRALDEAKGDEKKAEEILKARGLEIADKKSQRETANGLIDSYIHLGKIGVLVEVSCETDFVARNDEFKKFVHEIALQVAQSQAKNVDELLKEELFKEPGKTVENMLKETIGKIGENIKIKRFVKFVLSESTIVC